MPVEVLAVIEPAAVVLDLMTSDELAAELLRRGHVAKALPVAGIDEIAADLARRADAMADSAAVAWQQAGRTDDLDVLASCAKLARRVCDEIERLCIAIAQLDHSTPIDRGSRKQSIEASRNASLYAVNITARIGQVRRMLGLGQQQLAGVARG